jgi:microcystin-dependent protein
MSSDEGRSYDPQKDATAQEPLTANELKMVTRLFGDPFAFPMEFKAWLRGWLEEQFPRIGTLAVSAETGAAGAFVPPPGAMLDYGGDVAPGGYVLCNGAEYLSTAITYQRLFGVIGFKFGVGPSSAAHFKVPNREEAMSIMRGASAGMNTIGQTGGEKTHTLSAAEIDHRHGSGGVQVVIADSDGSFKAENQGIAATGGNMLNSAHNNMPPFLVVNVIISLGS